jgi:elongation factor G
VTNEAIVWNEDDKGMTFKVIPIPADLLTRRRIPYPSWWRTSPNYDDKFMEKYFEDPDSITIEEMRAAIRAAVCDHEIYPDDVWFFIQK